MRYTPVRILAVSGCISFRVRQRMRTSAQPFALPLISGCDDHIGAHDHLARLVRNTRILFLLRTSMLTG